MFRYVYRLAGGAVGIVRIICVDRDEKLKYTLLWCGIYISPYLPHLWNSESDYILLYTRDISVLGI